MGVAISHHSTLAPISLASTIIGFVSFTITLATLVRVFWDNIQTVWAADTEIYDYLGNLKAGLYEERRHLRRVARTRSKSRRRQQRGDRSRSGTREKERHDITAEDVIGDRTLLLLRDTVRHMLRSFKVYERPFLAYEAAARREADRRLSNGADWDPDWRSRGYGSEDDGLEGSTAQYRSCGLRERFIWLRTKGKVTTLYDGLEKIQVRRIANELGQVYVSVAHLERDMRHNRDRLQALDQRLSRGASAGARRAE